MKSEDKVLLGLAICATVMGILGGKFIATNETPKEKSHSVWSHFENDNGLKNAADIVAEIGCEGCHTNQWMIENQTEIQEFMKELEETEI